MKTKWVATLDARKYKAVSQCVKNVGTVLLMSLLFLIISCDKSDDFETIRSESPIGNDSPPDNELPPDNENPPGETPPDDETPPGETPSDNEPPNDAESVIIYTDIDPDYIGEELYDYYDLDLNNDQIVDFTLSSYKDGYEWWLDIFRRVNGNGIWSGTPWYAHPIPLDSGDEIFSGGGYENWSFFVYCYTGEQNCNFYWNDNVDKYLGLRFIINGQTHYGWAQVKVTSVTQWTIMDYAYNATPNKPILAGQRE